LDRKSFSVSELLLPKCRFVSKFLQDWKISIETIGEKIFLIKIQLAYNQTTKQLSFVQYVLVDRAWWRDREILIKQNWTMKWRNKKNMMTKNVFKTSKKWNLKKYFMTFLKQLEKFPFVWSIISISALSLELNEFSSSFVNDVWILFISQYTGLAWFLLKSSISIWGPMSFDLRLKMLAKKPALSLNFKWCLCWSLFFSYS
jgi:hypothetical protein